MKNQTPKIRVTRNPPPSIEQRLKENFDVVFNQDDAPLACAQLRKSMQEYDALLVTVSDQIKVEMLQCSSRRVSMIANVGIGFSNIDTGLADGAGMSQADVVSVRVPGGDLLPQITASHIASIKPTAYLVNTTRGDGTDQEALVDTMVAGRIADAGLDVFPDEARVPDQLRRLENVSLLPHIGSTAYEVRTAMGIMATENIEAFFSGADLPNRVV